MKRENSISSTKLSHLSTKVSQRQCRKPRIPWGSRSTKLSHPEARRGRLRTGGRPPGAACRPVGRDVTVRLKRCCGNVGEYGGAFEDLTAFPRLAPPGTLTKRPPAFLTRGGRWLREWGGGWRPAQSGQGLGSAGWRRGRTRSGVALNLVCEGIGTTLRQR